MDIDYTSLKNQQPEHPNPIYYKNTLRHIASALGDNNGLSFDSAWNSFASSNGFENNYKKIKTEWHLPLSLKYLKQNKKIDRPRTSLLLKISPTVLFGIYRYSKLPAFSTNYKQMMTFHQVSILQIELSKSHQFLIDNRDNHAARYVSKTKDGSVARNKNMVIYGPSSVTAKKVSELLLNKGVNFDIECNGRMLWVMAGGDRREALQLKQLIDTAMEVARMLEVSSDEYTLQHEPKIYTQLPYGRVGLWFRLTDAISLISFIVLLITVVIMLVAVYSKMNAV